MRLTRLRELLLYGMTLLLAFAAAGCASNDRTRGQRLPPQPLLFGRGTYFDDSVLVEATLGPFRLHPTGGTLDRRPPAPGEGEPIPVRGGGFGQRGEAEASGGFPRGMNDDRAFGGPSGGPGGGRAGPGGGGGLAGMPRQNLVVTFRSQAADPLMLRVVEVKSALGNFVPVPETFTLAAGASQDLEPMRASYPAAIDELELLVALRLGAREETKVLHLKLAEPNPPR